VTGTPADHAAGLILIGTVVLLSTLARHYLARLRLPAVVAYIAAGLALGLANGSAGAEGGAFLTPELRHGIDVIAEVGLVVLLFRVGLESDVGALIRVLERAFAVFLCNFVVAGAAGVAAILVFTDYGLLAALFTGAALSATSVGISTAVWRDAGVLDSDAGALLVDVAELDDISAVIVIALLFALVPVIDSAEGGDVAAALAQEVVLLLLELAGLIAACYAFAHYAERRITRWFAARDKQAGPVLFAFSAALLIAALADRLGFSTAIGAMFAGLAFSADPAERRIDRALEEIYQVFTPFFFISVGLAVDLGAVAGSLDLALGLLAVAVAGKLAGAGVPVWLTETPARGWVMGWSMVPRAEIALIVMNYGLALGPWAVPQALYGAMVLVTLVTCLIAPVAVGRLLDRAAHER